MKRTTYILIGLFIAGLIVLVGGVLVIFHTGRPYGSYDIVLGGEQVTKEFPPCKVIWLTQSVLEKEGYTVWMMNSCLEVLPSEGKKNVFSCPKEVNDYLTMKGIGDTLKITLDYPMDKLSEKIEEQKYVYMTIGEWQMQLPSGVETIISDIRNQKLVLKNLSKDSLSIDVSGSATVEDCDLKALNVLRCGNHLNLLSGNIRDLYLYLDHIDGWNVDPKTCHIDTEYLTGYNANVQLEKGECKRMFWIPTKEDAKLYVTLNERSCITME